MSATCLVVENDPTAGLGHFAEWLTDGGLALELVPAHADAALPGDLTGYAALVVLGGAQHAYADPDGAPAQPWFPALESLLRRAVRDRLPTLGICLGAQLLATAHQGTVAPAAAGPEFGLGLIAKRDAADADPLFGPLPMLPDVVQWHRDEVTELPLGAVLLATSPACPVQAFRLGPAAWGVQFHPEVDLQTLQAWIDENDPSLAEKGVDASLLMHRAGLLQDDLFEVWHPFAIRFAALATGTITLPMPGRGLPVLGS